MRVKFKKLTPEAKAPYRASTDAAGYDLTATSVEVGQDYVTYGVGLSFEIPKGAAGFLFPRSSVYKTGLSLANSVGVLDADYRGEVFLKFRRSSTSLFYNVGERIGQVVFLSLPELELSEALTLGETERGDGGFGSTGGVEL